MFVFITSAYVIQREFPIALSLHKNRVLSPLPKLNRCFSSATTTQQSSKPPRSSSTKSKYKKFFKILGIGFGLGTVLTGGYMYNVYKKVSIALPNPSSGADYFLQELPPKHALARSIQNPADRSGLKITLYQFQTCPFCCKVRAFLDYYGFSYNVVEVNSVTHKQTNWTTYRKVPFLLVEQGVETVMQLKDSSMIISALQSFICNKTQTLEEIVKGYPTIVYINDDGDKKMDIMNRYFLMYGRHPSSRTKEEIVFERKWRKWVDDVYVHMLSPNVYRSMEEAFQAFNWFSEVGNWGDLFATWERLLVIYVGAIAMYFIGKRLKKRHNLKGDVRESLYDETNLWLREVKKVGGNFLGGNEPNLSDLSIYGVLTAIEGCDAFNDLIANTKIQSWFLRMREVVETHQGAKYLAERGANRP